MKQKWRALVQSPPTRNLSPRRVLTVLGDVSNPSSLVNGEGIATLRYTPGSEPPVVILDYGQEIAGISTYDVAGTFGTPVLHSGFSETREFLTPDGDDGGEINGPFLSGSPRRFEDVAATGPGSFSGPLVQGGQRYQYLTLSQPGTVKLRGVGFRYTGYLGTPDNLTGHFLSSDRLLNRIWYAGVYTLNLNQILAGTAQMPGQENDLNLITDGAKRDRSPWTGDQLVAAPTAFYSVPMRFVRDTLQLLGSRPATTMGMGLPASGDPATPGPMPGVCQPRSEQPVCMTWSDTYSMMYVIALRNYLLYSGDTDFVREAWPLVLRQMAYNEQNVNDDGLYAVQQQGAANWNIELHHTGVQTYVNAVYRRALLAAAAMGEAIGKTDRTKVWRAAAQRIREEVNRRFFNPTTGVYSPSAEHRNAVVQDANVEAVLSGIATGRRANSVLQKLRTALDTKIGRLSVAEPVPSGYSPILSPFMGSLNLEAEFEHGNSRQAIAFIRKFWGHMVNSDPGGVIWEGTLLDGKLTSGDSAAHAWSTGPTHTLSRYVLGIAPSANGSSNWRVKPQLGDLKWAQGSAATPDGRIKVAWRRGVAGFVMTVSAPKGTSGVIRVPLLGDKRRIAEDGRLVWNGRRSLNGGGATGSDNYVKFRVGGGTHTFAWAR